jgi:hypothetical protein
MAGFCIYGDEPSGSGGTDLVVGSVLILKKGQVYLKMRSIWGIAPCSLVEVTTIALFMEAVLTSEMSVYFNEINLRYIRGFIFTAART